jgi:hypothetical protein
VNPNAEPNNPIKIIISIVLLFIITLLIINLLLLLNVGSLLIDSSATSLFLIWSFLN